MLQALPIRGDVLHLFRKWWQFMCLDRRVGCLLLTVTLLVAASAAKETEPTCDVRLDASEVVELKPWGEKAQKLLIEWHPRLCNLLGSNGFVAPRQVEIRLRKSNEGVAGTANGRIEVSSHWIEKHPEDIGLVVHELAHVIQSYPNPDPGWLTEGIADYIRWGIYEGKPLTWFPLSDKPQGYRASYQVTGGFLLWLEQDRAPGIVHRLNTAMRHSAYDKEIFKTQTGLTLDELWDAYVKERKQS
jgi:hypothetical protein